MSNRSSGKKNVMEEYLSSLLTEEVARSEPLEPVSYTHLTLPTNREV